MATTQELIAAILDQQTEEEQIATVAWILARQRKAALPLPVEPIVQVVDTAKVVLQRDFVGVVGSPTAGFVEAEVTMDADGLMRIYSSPGSARSLSVTLVLSAGSTAWANMPGAATLMYGNAATVRAVDLSAYTQCRLTVSQFNAAASPAHLRLRYSASAAGSAGSYSAISASECEVALGTSAGMHYLDSGWETLDAGAIGEVYIAVVGVDGDGAADPAFLAVTAEFR